MATVAAVTCLCVLSVAGVLGAPAKTYDQRQEGELNIHAQLDNIVIVLIPASNINLLELAGKTKYSGEKPGKTGFMQLFQKPHKNDIDRYETVKDDQQENSQNDIQVEPVVSSQEVALNHEEKKEEKHEEKEEEVIATVEEMKPETTEKAIDPSKLDAVEDSPVKDQSTTGEIVPESLSVQEEHEGSVKEVEQDSKDSLPPMSTDNEAEKMAVEPSKVEESPQANEKPELEPPKNPESQETDVSSSDKKDSLEKDTAVVPNSAERDSSETASSESSESGEPSLKDLIRPVSSKEEKPTVLKKVMTEDPAPAITPKKTSEPARLLEGVRREKVIRYKPETKWAPQLVDLLGPPKPKELEERQRFASLCAPGVWDTELKTCIMPGETRSRSELARFLEAMRFGIAIPAK